MEYVLENEKFIFFRVLPGHFFMKMTLSHNMDSSHFSNIIKVLIDFVTNL